MVTITYRNPINLDFGQLLTKQIGNLVRAEVQEAITVHKIENPAIHYWRGRRGTPRAAASVSDIPDSLFKTAAGIGVFGKDAGGSAVSEAALVAAETFRRIAPVSTGHYRGSLMFRLNGKPMALATILRFAKTNPFSQRETVQMFPTVAYGSSLESIYARRAEKGLMSRIARELLTQFGQRRISIQLTYISGAELGLSFVYMVPLLTIGAAGAFPSKIRTPGKNHRRRKREARKKRA